MAMTVCTGGACKESGADLLLDACTVLAAGDAELEVVSAFCSGECPAKFAMICPQKGMMEAYEAPCSTRTAAIESAEAAIVAAGSSIAPGLLESFKLLAEAKDAQLVGDLVTARSRWVAMLDSMPAALSEPCQPPLPPEKVQWVVAQVSRWMHAARGLEC